MAAAARGHALNAAFLAWVERAAASDPDSDWSGAVAAYVAHCDALFAEAQAGPARAQAAKQAPGGREEEAGAPPQVQERFFGQAAAAPPLRCEDNPFAQGLDLEKEAREASAAKAHGDAKNRR